MENWFNNAQDYDELRTIRQQHFYSLVADPIILNQYHDYLMQKVVSIAMQRVDFTSPSPSSFAFFVMGSAGRKEQGPWSDQDHGMVYIESTHSSLYFEQLAEEITEGLQISGYEKCDGNVMATNPKWCKPLIEWKEQLKSWVDMNDWESVRNLLTFMDARVIMGNAPFIQEMKELIWKEIDVHPALLQRMIENTKYRRKPLNLLGQLILERYGQFASHFQLKEHVLIPYVNAIRLLSIAEKIQATSTTDRVIEICSQTPYAEEMQEFIIAYQELEQIRFQYYAENLPATYEESHYIQPASLTKEQTAKLKEIIKKGKKLHTFIHQTILHTARKRKT
ncbi:DUF294 nucleotidyltransferase-like domain-containing protein [Caldalkalibacillus mannanilyticus]|uniref:DUF294 nucleotidyltransferase-like domain-containing protein n=1 Tax=Caldalkalibacillus mannanilyticus TaxID=1418 RepID=UPI0004686281|nr:DUF294 nucleotidyltransferase-like domain-containing protein [Caldalkalibacillus mannanilyticus]